MKYSARDKKKKASRWKDPEFRREYMRNWRSENPDRVADYNYRDRREKNWMYESDPEFRRKLLEKAKQRWRDPEFRKRRAAYMREYRRKHREAGV